MSTQLKKPRLWPAIITGIILFAVFGAIGFIVTAEDYRGGSPDYAMCSLMCVIYGAIAAAVGFMVVRYASAIFRWWREPTEKN